MMVAHLRSSQTLIEVDLAKHHPKRAKLLQGALRAHDEGKYDLSIPVLLAQADGICAEVTGVQAYSRRDGVPKLAAVINTDALTPLVAALFYPLISPTPISASAPERAQANAQILNRHAVLHGEDVD